MNLQELLDRPGLSTFNNILVIGYPATGKTHASKLIAEKLPDHKFIHTDDYMQHGFEQSLYVLLNDLKTIEGPKIIEGLLGYRLLRKGVEQDSYYPDLVIDMQAPDEQIERVYSADRDPEKLKRVMATCKACDTIRVKYELLDNKNPPTWIQIDNKF